MTRVGQDSKTGCVIYLAPQRAPDRDDRPSGPFYYLKISPTEFLRAKPAPGAAVR